MALPTLARPAPTFEDERTELETMRREAERMRRETAMLADETLERIASMTRHLHAAHRDLEGIGQISELVRAVTIPPHKRKRPAPLARERASR